MVVIYEKLQPKILALQRVFFSSERFRSLWQMGTAAHQWVPYDETEQYSLQTSLGSIIATSR